MRATKGCRGHYRFSGYGLLGRPRAVRLQPAVDTLPPALASAWRAGATIDGLKEHAGKTTPARLTERYQDTSSRNAFNDLPP
jgi:hypothetical protein